MPSPKAGGGLIKYSRGEWLALIKALVLGIEKFNFHGRVWKPMEYENRGIPGFENAGDPTDAAWDEETAKGESFVADGQQLRHVHVTTAMTGGNALMAGRYATEGATINMLLQLAHLLLQLQACIRATGRSS